MLELSFGKAKTGFRNAVRIVFVTNLTSYAVAGYSVEAFDYVVNPVSYPRFASLLERVFRAADREGGGDISKAELSGTVEKGVDDDGDPRATLTISSYVYKWQDGSDITGDDYEAAGMTGTHIYEYGTLSTNTCDTATGEYTITFYINEFGYSQLEYTFNVKSVSTPTDAEERALSFQA